VVWEVLAEARRDLRLIFTLLSVHLQRVIGGIFAVRLE
jgi:hypothetical protein